MFNLFFKNSKDLKSFSENWNIGLAETLAISTNVTQVGRGSDNIQIESTSDKQQKMVQWSTSENESEITLIKNKKIINKLPSKNQNNESQEMSLILHEHMIRSREQLIHWAKKNTAIEKDVTLQDLNGEEKLLEWMKVSLVVLNKALENAIKDEESTLQMMLFSGVKDKQFHFKLRIYNLDIELKDTVHSPIIIVHDKKNQDDFEPKHQVLKGPLKYLTNPIVDEVIKLLPLIEVLIKKKVIEAR